MVEVHYKEIPNHAGYRVGTDGSVWSRRNRGGFGLVENWRQLKPTPQGKYLVVTIDGSTRKVHSLVLETFGGPRPKGQQCRHIDDNKLNNRRDNLRWGTPLENAEDRERNGHTARGEAGNSKLNADEVATIRLYRNVVPQKVRARVFGVSRRTIWLIDTGRTWSFS